MARPKKGAKGYDQAVKKWRKTMIEKYGGKDKLHKKMQEIGKKGGQNGYGIEYKGGFASDKVGPDGLTGYERARKVGALGGKISRRGPAKDDIEKAEEILEEESGRD